jgi:lipopolysaccharide transport system ATP-binding protein
MTRKELARSSTNRGVRRIEQFIDTPVKHYSSGMYVPQFPVAAHLEPEIL